MKMWGVIFLLGGMVMSMTGVCAELVLIDKGKSAYRIVVAKEAIPSERYAAEELQRYLHKMSGVTLPIVTDDEKAASREIVLGHNARLDSKIDLAKLGTDGFLLRTQGKKLIIAGGQPRGTLYGVYEVLEKLGVRWFARDVEQVPARKKVALRSLNETQHPAFAYREESWGETRFDQTFSARLRLNGHMQNLDEQHGGRAEIFQPYVHSLESLIPQSLYQDHPDYFPLVDGKRVGGYTERCFSHPEVLKLAIAQVRTWLKEHPEATIIDVSQNDVAGGGCQCDLCRPLNEAEGTPAATLLRMVNAIADDIAKDYPNVRIETLAYKATRKAPKTLRPRPNVIIRLCDIEICFVHPIAECTSQESAAFRKDIEDWAKIAPTLYIWDYTTNFAHYQIPYPNLDSLQPNVQLFAKYGTTGILEQGNSTIGGELGPLRAYVLAKLLWNPKLDMKATVDEFLRGYYGKAAGSMREFLELMQNQVRGKEFYVSRRTPPTSLHVNAEFIAQAEVIFARAEQEADNDDVRLRVQAARLPIWYVKIATDAVKGEEKTALVRRFMEIARKAGITHIKESDGDIWAWAKQFGVEKEKE